MTDLKALIDKVEAALGASKLHCLGCKEGWEILTDIGPEAHKMPFGDGWIFYDCAAPCLKTREE